MIELFLGVIAVSVLAMAIGQVVAVVIATRLASCRRADGALEATLRPIVDNMQRITDDTARATAIAPRRSSGPSGSWTMSAPGRGDAHRAARHDSSSGAERLGGVARRR